MSWTDERIDLLKKLWTDGLSASQIAAELGNVTRNAVIGKVHRRLACRARQDAACPAGEVAQDRAAAAPCHRHGGRHGPAPDCPAAARRGSRGL